MSIGEGADAEKSVGAVSMCLGNHDNPVSGHH